MTIRTATPPDLPELRRIYDAAKEYMDKTGNPHQWKKGNPPDVVLLEDMELGRLYVCEEEKTPHAVFMFSTEDDPTYHVIEDGAWLNVEPYGVIHRIASDGVVKGVFEAVLVFCEQLMQKEKVHNLRIDTHTDNDTMHHVLVKCGFTRCGMIHLENGSPRVAYQKSFGE